MLKKLLYVCFVLFFVSYSANGQDKDTSYYRGELQGAVVSAIRSIEQTSQIVRISPIKVQTMPSIMGEQDVLKIAQFIPGVVGGKEGDVGIRIRGGGFDQSMVLMDGAPIYNPFHFKGLVSAFNPDVIGETIILKGGFPAKYGGRLSGVMDVSIRDGDYKAYHGGITAGLFSSKLFFEGPIKRNTSSFIISGRKSYYNFYLKNLINMLDDTRGLGRLSDILDGMDYYDINAKYSHTLGLNHKISASFYIGDDHTNSKVSNEYNYEKDGNLIEESTMERRKYNTGNLVFSARWDYNISNARRLNSIISFSRYRSGMTIQNVYEEKYAAKSDYYSENGVFVSGISDLMIQCEFVDKTFQRHTIVADIGYSSQVVKSVVDFSREENISSVISTYSGTNGFSNNLNTFHFSVDDQINISSGLKMAMGVRLSDYLVDNKNYLYIEPRLRIKYHPINKLSLNGSFTVMSQGVQLLSNTNVVSKYDLWVSATNNHSPMRSLQTTLGVQYEIGNENKYVVMTIEGYYKKSDNIIEYLDGSSLASKSNWEEVVTDVDGWAYGVEIFMQKPFGKFTSSVAYTWSKSLRQSDKINGGVKYYDINDHRHNFSATLSHNINSNWLISLSYIVRSGDWYNIETLRIPNVNQGIGYLPYNQEYVKFQDYPYYTPGWTNVSKGRNVYQSELYHRMDLSLSYSIFHKLGKSELNLTIVNLYNKLNPYYIYVYTEGTTPYLGKVCLFPFIPSVSYNYKF